MEYITFKAWNGTLTCVQSESPGRHRLINGLEDLAATTQCCWFGEAEREILGILSSNGGRVITLCDETEAQGLYIFVRRTVDFDECAFKTTHPLEDPIFSERWNSFNRVWSGIFTLSSFLGSYKFMSTTISLPDARSSPCSCSRRRADTASPPLKRTAIHSNRVSASSQLRA